MTLAQLIEQGFDKSADDGDHFRVQCSQCVAQVINGVACHEHGCPNVYRAKFGTHADIDDYDEDSYDDDDESYWLDDDD